MDLRKLKTLIDLVSESDISELEITEAEGKVRIVKGGTAVMMSPQQYMAAPQQQAQAPQTAVIETAAPAAITGHTIKSPMVGTFYGASSPGTPPFVEIGTVVKKGQTVCIIESMKLLNEIEADADGAITQILIENGQPVEFGQPLFVIG